MFITLSRWTRLTPWTVTVSPVDDPDMPEVLTFQNSDDAQAAVTAHNYNLTHKELLS